MKGLQIKVGSSQGVPSCWNVNQQLSSLCLSSCLSVCLSVSLSVCLSVCQSVSLALRVSRCVTHYIFLFRLSLSVWISFFPSHSFSHSCRLLQFACIFPCPSLFIISLSIPILSTCFFSLSPPLCDYTSPLFPLRPWSSLPFQSLSDWQKEFIMFPSSLAPHDLLLMTSCSCCHCTVRGKWTGLINCQSQQ